MYASRGTAKASVGVHSDATVTLPCVRRAMRPATMASIASATCTCRAPSRYAYCPTTSGSPGITPASHARISGVCVNRLQPAAANSASSSPAGSAERGFFRGNTSRPGEARASPISRCQMAGRSRSTATTVAPSASSSGNGPIAEPAPSSTNTRSRRSSHAGVSDTARIASAADGSIVPKRAHMLSLPRSAGPDSAPFWYGTDSTGGAAPSLSEPTSSAVEKKVAASSPSASAIASASGRAAPPRWNSNALCTCASPARAMASASSRERALSSTMRT
mmetsp:Transcript_4988/g.13448  ORF Transcript_4988/g.13448 Transcript_4988/m.13448 type:complete len:277 (+) Transcript_4988:903-1733(+)